MGRRALTTERRGWVVFALVGALVITLLPSPRAAAEAPEGFVDLIVRAEHGMLDEVRRQVESLGGAVTLDLPIIDGFAATLPEALVGAVSRLSGMATTP